MAMAGEVLASAEARNQLPRLIEQLIADPEGAVEVGRQRRREVVVLSAARYDAMLEREQLIADMAWAAFAAERVEQPSSAPVTWEDAQRRRARAS